MLVQGGGDDDNIDRYVTCRLLEGRAEIHRATLTKFTELVEGGGDDDNIDRYVTCRLLEGTSDCFTDIETASYLRAGGGDDNNIDRYITCRFWTLSETRR